MSFFDGIVDAVSSIGGVVGDAIGSVAGGGVPWGSLISGGLGFLGQQSTNRQQVDLANQQMQFQQNMSGTAYQRAVSDMKAAGLNPMLAYSQGGASTPMGSMPVVQNASMAGVQSAAMAASIEKTKADTRVSDSQAALNAVQAQKVAQDTKVGVSTASNLDMQTKKISAEILNVPEIGNELRSRMSLQGASTRKVASEILNIDASTVSEKNRAALLSAQAKLSELGIPEASNLARAQSSWWKRNVSPYLPDIGGATRGASALGLKW